MAVTQNISNVRLIGTQTFNFTNPPDGTDHAMITIDRTVTGGLNSLTSNDTLEISIDRSPDGGSTWVSAAGIVCQGGAIVTKGITLARDTLTVGITGSNIGYRVTTIASTPVRIVGTVEYTP